MDNSSLNSERLNGVLKKTIDVIDTGRDEIFDILESATKEKELIKQELYDLQEVIKVLIADVDKLELCEKRSRSKLMIVSKNFKKYTEEDIKSAYEEANGVHIALLLKRQEEKDLREKRRSLELRLKKAMELEQKAQKIATQVGVAMDYLRGNIDSIIGAMEDMNKRQVLGIKIIQAQEEERQRVAREIHDGPAQSMANVVIKADVCEKLLSMDLGKTRDELKNLKEIVRGSLKDVRKIIYDLRPMSLDDLGLIPTVQRYAYNFMEETGIKVDVSIYGHQRSISSIIQLGVFRIIQEALNNIRKHSKATRVNIKIEMGLKNLNVLIIDDGIGFNDADQRNHNNGNEGFGIMGMKERAQLLNGKIDIKSNIGSGTKVILIMPIDIEEDNND